MMLKEIEHISNGFVDVESVIEETIFQALSLLGSHTVVFIHSTKRVDIGGDQTESGVRLFSSTEVMNRRCGRDKTKKKQGNKNFTFKAR